jgi:hypothetical protein
MGTTPLGLKFEKCEIAILIPEMLVCSKNGQLSRLRCSDGEQLFDWPAG